MHLLICFALKEEAAPFRKMAADRTDVSILITGLGRQNAEKSVREFLAANSGGASVPASRRRYALTRQARLVGSLAPPELVLTCGFAGGLNPDLKLGEVVFEIFSRSSRGDEAQIKIRNQSESPYVGCYDKLVAAGAKPTKFYCADRIATTDAEKKKLRAETGADAVEMESEAIHAVCRERGIPCATVRVISDTAGEDLPLDFNRLSKPDMSLDYGKLAWAIAKSPGKIGALLKLHKQTRFAAERLADTLSRLL
jgi:adenosylhomocysteine nucleosidase